MLVTYHTDVLESIMFNRASAAIFSINDPANPKQRRNETTVTETETEHIMNVNDYVRLIPTTIVLETATLD